MQKSDKTYIIEVVCPACKYIQYHNTAHIPENETYEVVCKHCGMLIKRKNTQNQTSDSV